MIDLEQDVIVQWNNYTKQWYLDKGYIFTKLQEKFSVKAKDLMYNSMTKVSVTCDYCGDSKLLSYLYYNKSTKNQTLKYACNKCGTKKLDDTYFAGVRIKQFQRFLDLCKERNHIPLSTIDDYKNNTSKLSFVCEKHGKKTVSYSDYMNNKTGCVDCGHELVASSIAMHVETVKEIVESKNNNILKNPLDYININISNLVVTCGLCKRDFVTSLSSIINSGGRCRECGIMYSTSLRKLTKEEITKKINSVNGNILLNPEDYIKNDVINLQVLCACGNIYTTSICNYDGGANRCPICTHRISKGELLVSSILDKLGIKYETEKIYEDCKDKRYLPFDFYLPEYNSIIEFDGIFHFKPVFSTESFIKTLLHDKIKNDYCTLHDISLLRIPYWETSNAETMIRNFLKLDKNPKIIRYHKNPYK